MTFSHFFAKFELQYKEIQKWQQKTRWFTFVNIVDRTVCDGWENALRAASGTR